MPFFSLGKNKKRTIVVNALFTFPTVQGWKSPHPSADARGEKPRGWAGTPLQSEGDNFPLEFVDYRSGKAFVRTPALSAGSWMALLGRQSSVRFMLPFQERAALPEPTYFVEYRVVFSQVILSTPSIIDVQQF